MEYPTVNKHFLPIKNMANLLQLAKEHAKLAIDGGSSTPSPGAPQSMGGVDRSQTIVMPMMDYLDELDEVIDKDEQNKPYYRIDTPVLSHVVKSKVTGLYRQAGQDNMALAFGTFADYMNDYFSPWAAGGMPLGKMGEFLFDMDGDEVLHRGDELSYGMRSARDLMFKELGNRAREVEARNNLPPRWEQLFGAYAQASQEQDDELAQI